MSVSPTIFMQEALQVAAEGLKHGELPIGAVVVLNDQIIARAYTTERTERRLLVHAELRALLEADHLSPFPGRRSEVALFTTLEPCLMCMGAAMSFFLGTIYYALEAPGDGATALVSGWQRKDENFPVYRVPVIAGGLLKQESLDLFKAYVTQHPSSSGPLWEYAKALIESVQQKEAENPDSYEHKQ
jgi:tRNA(adenine34) deaminase